MDRVANPGEGVRGSPSEALELDTGHCVVGSQECPPCGGVRHCVGVAGAPWSLPSAGVCGVGPPGPGENRYRLSWP